MDTDHFRLKDDDTMRRLRVIAQTPGELQWRLELLSTLERMRVTAEVTANSILQNQRNMQKVMAHLTPMKLAELMNAQIDEKMKPRDKDMNRMWKSGVWLLEKAATIGITVAVTMIGLRSIH